MSSWKAGAAQRVMSKVSAGKALTEHEIKTLQSVAGRPKVPLVNPPPPIFLNEDQRCEGYKKRVGKERLYAPNAPDNGDQMLPFVTACERRAEELLRHGPNPVAWHGKFKLGFDTSDTVDSLFVDSEYTRIKEAERDQLRSLKAQLREERTKRRALERTAVSLHSEQQKEMELLAQQRQQQAAEASAAAQQRDTKIRLPPRSSRTKAMATQLQPMPVKTGGTGYGGAEPHSFYDLHPAAQAVLKYATRTGDVPRSVQPQVPHRLPAISSAPAHY